MKYSVTYACGHDGEVVLYGKTADRERKLGWYETCDCPECYKAKKNAAAISAAAESESENDMPVLNGSEKQVAWARSIRANRIADFFKLIANASGDKDAVIAKVIGWMRTKTDAKFWIDTREEIRFVPAHAEEWNA